MLRALYTEGMVMGEDALISREKVRESLQQLWPLAREHRIYFGTSSWKYPGWKGVVYTREYGNKKAFAAECLEEYARLFPAVGVDFTFYSFPTRERMRQLADQTPETFRFGLKVTEELTVHKYPTHARYGPRRGALNESFLDPAVFVDRFLPGLEPLGSRLGPLMFEFGYLPVAVWRGGDFLERLDGFLEELPSGYRYAVEIRNRDLLGQPYFDMLRRHSVAHVFNSWTRMPPIGIQAESEDAFSTDVIVARALLRPGRTYADAVKQFEPYEAITDPWPPLRRDLVNLMGRAMASEMAAYLYVNNRAEGNAPATIAETLRLWLTDQGKSE
jgi:uncharacterized protein YecE (DUF72 family)